MDKNKLNILIKNKKIITISCMLLLLILAFLFGKIENYMVKNYIFMTGLFGLVILAEIWIFIHRKKISIKQLIQFFPIAFVSALFWNLCVISKYSDKTHYVYMILGEILFNAFFLELVLILLDREKIGSVWNWIKARWNVWVIYLIFIICTIPTLRSWQGLDGTIYYQSLRNIRRWDFVNIFNLQLCGHVSQGYSIFALIGEYLFPGQTIGVRIINIILALIAIYAFYKIVEKLFVNASTLEKTLCTCMFAFSPMLLGMIQEINLDFPILCFFTCMVYAYMYNYEIWIIAFSVLLCFSKEPGVILYGMFMLGTFFGRIIEQFRKNKKIDFMKLFSKDIILAAIGGVLWIALYFGNSNRGWIENTSVSEETTAVSTGGTLLNTFAVDWDYILVRLKQMFLINFSWLIVLTALIGLIVILLFKLKNREIKISFEKTLAIIFSFIGFIIYNCFYITWIHYRYLMVFVFFISFFYISVYSHLKLNKLIKLTVTCIITTLIFVSNFITIDPVSVRNFNYFNTGKTGIIIPCVMSVDENKVVNINREEMPGGDINNAALYNFEWSYFSMAYDHMLDKLDYNSKKLILMDDKDYRINCYFGIYNKLTNSLFWNKNEKHLNMNTFNEHDGDEYELFNIKMVDDISVLEKMDLSNYEEVYMLDMPTTEKMKGLKKYEHFDNYKYAMWSWDIYKIK